MKKLTDLLKFKSDILEFWKPKGIRLMDGYPIILPDDHSTLFVCAGIQPWKSWVLDTLNQSEIGRISFQWCVKTNRLDLIGSTNYLTSFEMLEYVLKGTLDREEVIGGYLEWLSVACSIKKEKLFFGINDAAEGIPADLESYNALKKLGIPDTKIFMHTTRWSYPFKPDGNTGPHLFVVADLTEIPCGAECLPGCTCGRFFHFWNIEFLDYLYKDNKLLEAKVRTVDSAGCFERLISVKSGKEDIFQTIFFENIRNFVKSQPHNENSKKLVYYQNMITEHSRTISLLLSFGVIPSPHNHGYTLRRLIRRCLTALWCIDANESNLIEIVRFASNFYLDYDRSFVQLNSEQTKYLTEEINNFSKSIETGKKLYHKQVKILATHKDTVKTKNFLSMIRSSTGVPQEMLEKWALDDNL